MSMIDKYDKKWEFSFGAVLYKKKNNTYKYLVVKDRNNNYSFPKGHQIKGEKDLETAVREVKEEVGIDLHADKYFKYNIDYELNETTQKSVSLYMADIGNQKWSINDAEIKEILLLDYESAYNLITFQNYKDILKEVNERLTKNMKICCMFDEDDSYVAHRNARLECVKNYGDHGYGHDYYVWNEGERYLARCKKCGAYVLVQDHEMHMPDHTYIDYFPVRDAEHAEEVNKKYGGYDIELKYPYKKIFVTFDY